MTAQPATRVRWNGNYFLGNDVLVNIPDLGSIVAATIAGWSIVEARLGIAFAGLIGTKQPAAMGMYSAARSFEVQRDLLTAAVEEILPKRYAEVFKAAMIVLTRASIHRHRFAHWLWGASADPDLRALALIEPKHSWNLAARQFKYWKRLGTRTDRSASLEMFSSATPNFPHQHILVYRLNDLNEALLRALCGTKAGGRAPLYRWLCNEVDIRMALEKVRKGQKRIRPAPRGSRRAKPSE